MFTNFFQELKSAGLPVTLKEYLTLLEGLGAGIPGRNVESFYYLSRACLIKDERHLDRFDRVFGQAFKGITALPETVETQIPEDWLRLVSELHLSEDDKRKIAELGGWEKIMEELKKRLAEQEGRHAGGNKWIGTGGTSPFGAYGYNPAGVRIGQHESRHRRLARATSKLRCVACARLLARAQQKSLILPALFAAPQRRVTWIFIWSQSAIMR
jgi:uncharacterized protein with von Willebrand factor type A (vWA) domain